MKSQSSTGDRGGTRCKYLQFWFWLDTANHWWLKYNDSRLTEEMNRRIVEPARKEGERKATSNGVIWSNSRKG